MSAAWLLDGRAEVVVYERNEYLGGHAHSQPIEHEGRTYSVDDGFSWFSERMYPHLLSWLDHMNIGTRKIGLTASFVDKRSGRSVSMPPENLGDIWRLLSRPSRVPTLLRMNKVVKASVKIVQEKQTDLTAGEFLRQLELDSHFVEEFMLPFCSGTWGAPHHRAREFSVYPLMKYIVLHQPQGLRLHEWQIVDGGAMSYINRVRESLDKAEVRGGCPVRALEPDEKGTWVHDAQGRREHYDHVIICCGAKDARELLERSEAFEKARAALSGFEYYRASVAVHKDTSFMPDERGDWAVANIRWTGEVTGLTVWAGYKSGDPIFASYVHGDEAPEGEVGRTSFNLPFESPNHFKAQAALDAVQGLDGGLRFAGDYTRDLGSHEDAVTSAMDAVTAIDPDNPRAAWWRDAAAKRYAEHN